jgi:hypothetical protein
MIVHQDQAGFRRGRKFACAVQVRTAEADIPVQFQFPRLRQHYSVNQSRRPLGTATRPPQCKAEIFLSLSLPVIEKEMLDRLLVQHLWHCHGKRPEVVE